MTTQGKSLGIPYSEQDFDAVTATTGTFTTLTATTLNATSQNLTGGQIGAASTSLVAFYGATVTTQPATIAAVTTASLTSVTTTGATTSTPFGYTTSTQADAIVTLVNAVAVRAAALTTEANAVRAAMVTLGLVAAA